ncbi:MAG: hypothetical protein DMF92_18650, partial [Acidobacteria bacterium]
MGAALVPRAHHTAVVGPGTGDARRHRVQAANHRARGRRNSRREHRGSAEHAPRPSPDQNRRPKKSGRPSVPVRDDEGIPDSVRIERP